MRALLAAALLLVVEGAGAQAVEILAPLYVEYESQDDIFIYVPANPDPAFDLLTEGKAPPSVPKKYVVQEGDTLMHISRKVLGTAKKWKIIYDMNRDVLPDPGALKTGLELTVSEAPQAPPASRIRRTGLVEADKILEVLDRWINPDRIALLRAGVVEDQGRKVIPFSHFRKVDLNIEFREDRVETHVFIPPEWRKPRVHFLRELGIKVSQDQLTPVSPFSAYTNFFASQAYNTNEGGTADDGFAPFGLGLNGAFNLKSYVMEWNAAYHDRTVESSNWSRQDVRFVKDSPDSLRRVSVGDLNYPTSTFQQFRTLGGVSVTSEFSLQPYRMVVPSGNGTFFLKSSSVVTIIRNGERLQSYNLAAGTHSIRDLPVSPGINSVVLEIRDDTGRIEYIEVPVAITSLSLAKGVHQYTYNAGYKSEVSGSDIKYDEDRPTFSGYHRLGVSDHLTLGASFQADKDQNASGAEILLATSLGSFQLDGAFSHIDDSEMDGTAARLLYNFDDNRMSNKSYRSISASVEWNSLHFSTLGDTEPERSIAWIYTLSYSQQLSKTVTGSVSGNYIVNRALDQQYQDSHQGEIGLAKTFGYGLYANLTAGYGATNRGTDEWRVHSFLSYSMPERRQTVSVTSDVEHTEGGKRQDLRADWRYSRGGRSNRLEVLGSVKDGLDTDDGSLDATYTGNRGQLGFSQNAYGNEGRQVQHVSRAIANTGVAYTGGRFSWGQPISDSFAIVTRPSHWKKEQAFDVNPGPDETRDARADRWGPALVSGMNSYQYYQIFLDNTQLEEGYQFDPSAYVLLPTYKSGFLLQPGTDASVLLTGKLQSANGAPIGLITGTVGKIEFFTNADGAFSIEGLKPGRYKMVLEVKDDKKWRAIEFTIPDDKSGHFDIGVLNAVEQ